MKMNQKGDSTQDLAASHIREKKIVQCVRKWLRKITAINEVLRHVSQARSLASHSSALALFTLFTEKVSQNSSFPYALKSTVSNIQHRKALYLVIWEINVFKE